MKMLGKFAWRCRCCDDAPDTRGTQRQREKRVTQKWLDEYENRPEILGITCPSCGTDDYCDC